MRTIQITWLIVTGGFLAAISACKPNILSSNKFLSDFVNHEYINILAVIVTVSLVSVVQIHLEYSRVERRFNVRVFKDARDEINKGAALLITMLVSAFVISFFRATTSNQTAISFIHSLALLTILASILIMYDFIRTVCVLASEEPFDQEDQKSKQNGSDSSD